MNCCRLVFFACRPFGSRTHQRGTELFATSRMTCGAPRNSTINGLHRFAQLSLLCRRSQLLEYLRDASRQLLPVLTGGRVDGVLVRSPRRYVRSSCHYLSAHFIGGPARLTSNRSTSPLTSGAAATGLCVPSRGFCKNSRQEASIAGECYPQGPLS
jgi:hypothetical protein